MIKLSVLFAFSLFILLAACGSSGGGGESKAPETQIPELEETEVSELEKALTTGIAADVNDEQTYVTAALTEISQSKERFDTIKSQLFNLGSASEKLTSINWDPTHDAAILKDHFPLNDTVLFSTNSTDSAQQESSKVDKIVPFAIAGTKQAETGRYLVFGSNPFRNVKNDQMDTFLLNSLTWLSGKAIAEENKLNVVFTQLDESTWFKDRSKTREWFDTNLANKVTYNTERECDGVELATCMDTKNPDVIIISRHINSGDDEAAILAAVNRALSDDIAVIYIQLDDGIAEHGKALLNIFNVTRDYGNTWTKLELNAFDPQTVYGKLSPAFSDINHLLQNFKNSRFDVDLSGCEKLVCPVDSGVAVEFFDGAKEVQKLFNVYDENKIDIFESDERKLQKILILLADTYRQTVTYPMDKVTTDTTNFFKSLYADYAVYNYRDINPVQVDMGNFSRSDFSHITPENLTVNLTSKVSFRSAGVYALPGQTFTVTRKDSTDAVTHVFINTLRSGATLIFNEDKYNRPHFVRSQSIELEKDVPVKFTSSYGGPIQIQFDKNDLDVSFEFSNIGRHPYWSSVSDDVSFIQQLADNHYDWAEMVTLEFEIHSKLDKMKKSLDDSVSLWPKPSDFAAATDLYAHNKVNVLAGYQGPRIDVESEIHDFVTGRGLEVKTVDRVQHMNADQPTCGAGCSGNPYDAGWTFNPLAHGDLHEIGHGFERSAMRFTGYGGHSHTNFYSYFVNSIYQNESGDASGCKNVPFDSLFDKIKASMKEADPFTYMKANFARDSGNTSTVDENENYALYMQLMMAAQAHGKLVNGWFIYPRLHIWDREISRFNDDDTTWGNGRAALGFDSYTLTEFKALSTYDRLFISLSEITQLNLTDWFKLYGFTVSDKAIAQVASKNHTLLSPTFYDSTNKGYCSTLVQTAVAIVDTDDDGVIDSIDAFPNDPAESADSDGDGIGDNADNSYDLDPAKLDYANVEIQSQRTSECLSIDTNTSPLAGQKVLTAACNNTNDTLWSWGDDGQLHTNADASLCVSVDSLSSAAQLKLVSCAKSSEQTWNYTVADKVIKSIDSDGLAFDLYTNKEVHLYGAHSGSNQQWNFIQH